MLKLAANVLGDLVHKLKKILQTKPSGFRRRLVPLARFLKIVPSLVMEIGWVNFLVKFSARSSHVVIKSRG